MTNNDVEIFFNFLNSTKSKKRTREQVSLDELTKDIKVSSLRKLKESGKNYLKMKGAYK